MISTSGLSLDQAPPLRLPLGLFLTAPWLAMAAGILIAVEADTVLVSRWTPAALAATHLLAIGFLGQVMVGALLQMLPVIAGAPVPLVGLTAVWTHLLLALGSVLLAGGFMGAGPVVLAVGAAAAGLGFAGFLVAAALALGRAQGAPSTRVALRLAALSLAVTVLLGLTLTSALLGWVPLPAFPEWVQAHLSFGLFGWVGLLIVGVAYQVVPLFHVTRAYPRWMAGALAPVLFSALTAAAVLNLIGAMGWASWAYAAMALGFAGFAVTTVILQVRRSRPRLDATLIHWWIAMAAVLTAVLAWPLGARPELIGVLVLVGVGVGLPSGMLLKIVPFLCWFHLQSRQVAAGRFDVRLPHMHRLLPERLALVHPPLHGLALILLSAGVWQPDLARLGGIALSVAALWLFLLIAMSSTRYRSAALALQRPDGGSAT
jgi:hypothetical protein